MKNEKITLDRLELHLVDLPQKSVFTSGIGIRKSKQTLLIKWIDKDGIIGYGECSCRPDPYYSDEFLTASLLLVETFVFPKLKAEQTYGDILDILNQIRGWNFTKSGVESAVFQVLKQKSSVNFLSKNIKSRPLKQVPVGISLGIYNDKDEFYKVVKEAIEEGYERIKFKISPVVNTEMFDFVNQLLFDNDVYVSFDANGSYKTAELEKMRYFVETYDAIIEQPTPPDRFDTLLAAKEMFPTLKICFDEEVKSIGDLIKLHKLGVVDELNLKVGRVGGISNSIEIMNYCYANDIPCWMGGMFETGVGRTQNIEIAAHLPVAVAHDLSPSSRYFKEDIVSPEIKMENGYIEVSTIKECKTSQELIDKYTVDKRVLKCN